MFICGLNKTTLLDYPGHTASTIFLGGCNFRCPFCQNKDLILHPADYAAYTMDEIMEHLKKRAGVLSGICITGGEPTLDPELPDLIRACKEFGYRVKLDTNGTNPELVKSLCKEKLIDYVAMDIKSGRTGYPAVAGLLKADPAVVGKMLDKMEETASFLLKEPHDPDFTYEFRTTVVRELHSREDFEQIAEWIKGAPLYFLQSYRESEGVLQPGFSAYTKEELLGFADQIRDRIPSVALRGVD